MLIYEKDNKLNINFENTVDGEPDLQIGKSGDKTEVFIDGQESGSSSGVSSLADLSDVEIQGIDTENILLRFNNITNKWENVRPIHALSGNNAPEPGVLAVDDIGCIYVDTAIYIDASSEAGQLSLQLLQAAITNGHHQQDNLAPQTFRDLVDDAIRATANNSNLVYVIVSKGSILHRFNLVGANSNLAVWSGVVLNGDTFYRVTLSIICPSIDTPASVVMKAEQLMTFTEPT